MPVIENYFKTRFKFFCNCRLLEEKNKRRKETWFQRQHYQPTPRPAAIYQQQHCRSLQQREYTMNSPPFSRIYYEFTVCIVNLVRILVGIRWFSMNSVGVSRTFFKFTICFANSLWIFYLFREYIKNSLSFSRIHYLFSEYTKKSLSISRIHYPFSEFHLLRNDYVKQKKNT